MVSFVRMRQGIALAVCTLSMATGAKGARGQVDFVETGPYSLPGNAAVLTTGDVDGDGDLDLVTAHSGSEVLRFSYGDGTGQFSLDPVGLDVGFTVGSMAVADFDGDGLADLVVTSLNTQSVDCYRHFGGGLLLAQSLDPGGLPTYVLVADFSSDGIGDLAIAKLGTPLSPDPTISVIANDGLGNFTLGVGGFVVGSNPLHMVAADFDGDTLLDLAVAAAGFPDPPGGLALLRADGPLSFEPAVDVGPPHPLQLAAADFDGDGLTDLAAIVATDPFACAAAEQLFDNDGAGAFTAGGVIDFGCGPFAVAAADFNVDGAVDLLLTDGGDFIPAANYFLVAERDSSGVLVPGAETYSGLFTLALPAIGDFDGDGREDVAFGGYSGGLGVYLNDSPAAESFRRGDVNEDGQFDIADPVRVLTTLFVPGTTPLNCADSGDGNDDGAVDIADAIFFLSALFVAGSPQPPAPFPNCGTDPTADTLSACAQPAGGC